MNDLEIRKFCNEFLKRTGVELSVQLPGGDDDAGKIERFINRVNDIIEAEIWKYNPHFRLDRLDEFQKEQLLKAQIEQGLYLLSTGDLSLISGYDPINATFVPVDELRKRAFSPLARQYLMRAGLLYRGIGNVRTNKYYE